jgi:hypothetical protein
VLTTDQQQVQVPSINNSSISTTPTTAKRTGSASNIVEGASPSKRRKVNSNENCSMIIDDSDVPMRKRNCWINIFSCQVFVLVDVEAMNTNKINILEDTSNVTEMKSSPLMIISNDEIKLDPSPSTCTLLIPKRKQTAV